MGSLFHKYKTTVFTRIILSYTILAVVLMGLAGGYLYAQANRMMVDEIARESKTRLEATRDYMEKTLLVKYENDLQTRLVYTTTHHNNNNLYPLMDSGWDGNLSKIVSLRQDLEFLKAANEGISNLTIYFKSGNYVVDSFGFFMRPENSTDAEFLLSLDSIPMKTWFPRSLVDGKQVMSYAVMLPYQSADAAKQGYFIVDLDMSFIRQSAANILGSPSDRLYMMNKAGKVIVQTAESREEELALLQNAQTQSASVVTLVDPKLGKAVLSHLDGTKSSYGWSYAMVRSMNSFVLSSKQYQTSVIIGCGAVLLLGLLISYMMSRQFYNPIKGLIANLRSLYQPQSEHAPMNEYALIDNALRFMGQKIKSLEIQADSEKLKNIITGTGQGTEFPEAIYQCKGYQVAYMYLLKGDSEQIDLWYERNDHPPQCHFIVLNAREGALLYKTNDRTEGRDQVIGMVLHEMKTVLRGQVEFGAAIGPWVGLPEEIQISYRMAVQAYRYRFLYGADAVILHSKITGLDPNPQLFAYDMYKNMLKAGDLSGADKFLDEFLDVLKARELKLEAVEMALLQLVTSLYQVVIELELQEMVSPSTIFDELKKSTLHDTMNSIRAVSSQIAIHVRDSSNNGHVEVIMKLKRYIDEHLGDELSLNVMSDVASLAPAYVSTLFGEIMKESFTEYVTRVRLEQGAALLREEGRMPVAAIAEKVGYRNHKYFHNKFKMRFGITPAQYRNIHATASESSSGNACPQE
ncbi:helix-turn-helix domain-containing protein [Paenibacillus oryzisoli]|uniref:helix-turn-helix domain-containing protein n=1 Tax=Paenibacillus oryzisoli TaxID=1850517 RepID=UPI003D268E60